MVVHSQGQTQDQEEVRHAKVSHVHSHRGVRLLPQEEHKYVHGVTDQANEADDEVKNRYGWEKEGIMDLTGFISIRNAGVISQFPHRYSNALGFSQLPLVWIQAESF